jgi:hypothetical protein
VRAGSTDGRQATGVVIGALAGDADAAASPRQATGHKSAPFVGRFHRIGDPQGLE